MAAVMNPPKPSFFVDHDRASTKSRSSSLKDFAMRGRRAFMMTSILGSKDDKSKKASPSKSSSPAPSPAAAPSSAAPTSEPVASSQKDNSNAQHRASTPKNMPTASSSRLPPTKSKSILRRMSTAFHKPAVASDAPAVPSVSLQQKRDAALRARGLLPPLAPSKDLSQQELEQDARCSPCVELKSDSDGQQSEALRIKADWEAKNRSTELEQRSKMNNFRFGGSATSSTPNLSETLSEALEVVEEVHTPNPSPTTPSRPVTRPPPLKIHPATPLGSISYAGPSWSDASSVPLPPSPLPTLHSVRCASPTLVPLPLSPSPSSVTFFDTLDAACNELLPPSPSDGHSLNSLTASESHETDEGSLHPTRNRSHTFLSVSQESSEECSTTNSLYASSHTLSVHTSDSTTSLAKHKSAAVKAWAAGEFSHEIHVIAESPREGSPVQPAEEKEEKSPSAPLPRRRQTEPTEEKKEKRKSLNIFRAPTSGSSMAHLRRSVVGTLSRKETKSPMSPSFPPPSPRLAVAPPMYSRGSILVEASEIEDDESRRMTEMAFLY